MNHFEQLAAEWLQFNGYFVRTGVLVGPRPRGGFEGELDVVAFHPGNAHLLHIECSLDGDSWDKRERRFAAKFERGRRFTPAIFESMGAPATLDQVALLQFTSAQRTMLAGVRIVSGVALVHEIMRGLQHTSPASGAVSSGFPLVRTLQLAAAAAKISETRCSLIPAPLNLVAPKNTE